MGVVRHFACSCPLDSELHFDRVRNARTSSSRHRCHQHFSFGSHCGKLHSSRVIPNHTPAREGLTRRRGIVIKRFRHRQIISQSLMFAAVWGLVQYLVDYPFELWAGVGVIVYPALYVARFIVAKVNDFALQKTVVALEIDGLEDLSTSNIDESFSWHALTFIVSLYFCLAVGYITMGRYRHGGSFDNAHIGVS